MTNIGYQPRLKTALQSYSVDVDAWWDGMGDTDQMLSAREFIESRFGELDATQLQVLRTADARVMVLANAFVTESSWDVAMLKKIAAMAARHTETT